MPLYDETDEKAFDFLPEDEQAVFHWMNCPAYQVGYYEKEIGQQFNHKR